MQTTHRSVRRVVSCLVTLLLIFAIFTSCFGALISDAFTYDVNGNMISKSGLSFEVVPLQSFSVDEYFPRIQDSELIYLWNNTVYHPSIITETCIFSDSATINCSWSMDQESADGTFHMTKNAEYLQWAGFGTGGSDPFPLPMYMFFYYTYMPNNLLKNNLLIGDNWSEIGTFVDTEDYSATTYAMGIEEISVPAGIFSAIKLKTELNSSNNYLNGTRYIWLAEDVGIVKLTYQHSDGSVTCGELKEYGVVSNKIPIANFTYSPSNPAFYEIITFNASNSTDSVGSIMNYEWDFGDGNVTNTTEPTINHSYISPGVYTVNLTVTDNDGLTNTTALNLTISTDLCYTTKSRMFSPFILFWSGAKFPMSADSANIDLVANLQTWYDEDYLYTKGASPAMEMEYKYWLLRCNDQLPIGGSAYTTFFAFPIVEIEGQTGLGAFENEQGNPDRPNVTALTLVNNNSAINAYDKTTNGTIRLEKTYLLKPGETVQFLDRKLQYKYIVVRNASHYAKVEVWYAGNSGDDTALVAILGVYDDGSPDDPQGTTWFDRHNQRYGTSDHTDHVTWYARFEYEPIGDCVEITVGKEISTGDTFYVNSVRYDVPEICVNDTDGDAQADKFECIMMRTPLPQGNGTLQDDGFVSSQWIEEFELNEIVPVLPPYNMWYNVTNKPPIANIVINEFVSDNTTEWVELYNKGTSSVDLTGWTLEDEASNSKSLAVLGTIAGGGYKVYTCTSGWLNNAGDIIWLNDSTGANVDRVGYETSGDAPVPDAGRSTGRCPNGVDTDNDAADFTKLDITTAGAANACPRDATAPTTTYVVTPTPNAAGWNNVTQVNVTFFRTDPEPNPSGVDYTEYSMTSDVGPWTTVAGEDPFTASINIEGITTIWFYSVDKNETPNVEATKSVAVKIDVTNPVINSVELDTTTPDAGGPVIVTVDVTDALSNVARVTANGVELTKQNSPWNGTLTAESAPGTYNVTIIATDNAGNTITDNRVYYTVECTPPNISWNVTISATNQLESVVVGMHQNATDEYDLEYDVFVQTPVQGKVILILDYIYSTSMKKTRCYNESVSWTLTVGVPVGQTTTLEWEVPPNVNLTILNGDTVLTSGTLLGEGSHDLTVVADLLEYQEFCIDLKAGWNMVSIPVIPDNNSVQAIFGSIPTLDTMPIKTWESPLFIEVDEIESKKGYWIFTPVATTICITGKPITNKTLNLKAGWNMVGTVGMENMTIAAVPNQVSICPAVTWISPSFIETDIIEPGKAAWVFVTQDTIATTGGAFSTALKAKAVLTITKMESVTSEITEEWNITLSATNQLEPVTFGLHPNATDGYDSEYDAFTQTPVQEKVILILDNIFATEINRERMAWNLSIGVPTGETTTLTWNPSEIPVDITLTLDGTNMKVQDSLELGEGSHSFVISGSVVEVEEIFDTGEGTYPSISGTHNGTITPNVDIAIDMIYTYPCAGTGGHTKYAAFSYTNGTLIAEAYWNGYVGDWYNISFSESFTLHANETYNYTIRTGSYPQIHHNGTVLTANGWINCTEFTDANGKRYNNWIPAIRLD